MPNYKKHIFFCLNQRDNGKKCCNEIGATDFLLYAKQKIRDLKLDGLEGIRVNRAGCLGCCKKGPNIVIYPEAVWYSYKTKEDIDEIIESYCVAGKVVTRLLHKDET